MARPTVLIVDDDREVTQYLSDIFKGEGWKVLCEKDGDWAIKTFMSRRIDAVILDILIPVLNGFQVADAIRADSRGKDVPIVIISGIYRGAENRREAIERYGLLEYLNKPVEGDHVRRLLKEALGKRAAGQRKASGPVRMKPPLRRTSRPGMVTGPREAQPLQPEPRVVAREPVALRGSLDQTPFGLLLHELYKLQATGALFIMRGSVKKIVYLNNGQPVFIKSNKLRECLGQLLVGQERITADQAEQTFKRSRAEKVLHGQVLVRESLLTADELTTALGEQLEVKLFEIFGWPKGEFQFKENARIPDVELKLQSSCATNIVRGVARFYATEQLERELAPSLSTYPALASDPFLRYQQLELDPAADPLAEALDGTRTLGQLLDDPGWSRRQALGLVHALYSAGVIDLWDRSLDLPPVRSVARRQALFGDDSHPRRDDPQLEEHLAADLVKLKKRDHFRVLELPRSADSADVEAAFDRAAWRFHPDAYLGASKPVRGLAEGIFNRLRAAYLVLRTPFRREGYLEQLGRGQEASDDDASLLRAAKRHYEDGMSDLNKGRYEKAAWHLRRALALDERDASYSAYLGWAVHKNGPTDHVASKEARRHLERAIQLDPQLDTPHLFFGYLYLAEDETDSARTCFEKVLQINPDNKEAAEQLKVLESR
jgi:CheY-like chemotaxis protein/tetratricopeptide (TPR) repeat protein